MAIGRGAEPHYGYTQVGKRQPKAKNNCDRDS